MKVRTFEDAPTNFRVETTFNNRRGTYKIILGIPVLRLIFSELLIRLGKIYLRPLKVDRSKPSSYWYEGFQVRNMSQRQDGTYLTAGGVAQFKNH